MLKKLYLTQVWVLVAGSLFAWYTVYVDFARFYGIEGTLLKIKDCAVPNPVVTPCFYGAIAFILALAWSIKIYKSAADQQIICEKKLRWLLVASVLFAWGNFVYIFTKFYQAGFNPTAGCSGVVTTSPFLTPCFFGMLFFILALIIAIIIIVKHNKTNG